MSEKKRRCFIIGPIGKPGSDIRKHADMLLNAVIREALEGSNPLYEVVRSDEVTEPGMINDHVIHDILNADLVVADLTYLNANAFYELGIRHAAEKPVINFAQVGTDLPFDTSGYRAIVEDITSWDGIERAREQIRQQAKATEAEGYRVSNPITQANASFRMRQSADPKEQVIADILARLERLEGGGPSALGVNLVAHLLPLVTEDRDLILVGGYVIQALAGDHMFSLSEANEWLKSQDCELANPAASLKANLIEGRVSRRGARYRVTESGVRHLEDVILPFT